LLGERGLDLAQLETPMRRVIFTTYAVLIGLALSVALREQFQSPAVVADPGIPFPIVVVVIAAFVTVLALSLVVAGTAHVRSWWRYLLLAPLVAAIVVEAIVARPGPSLQMILATHVAPLLLAAGCIAVIVRAPRMRSGTVLWVTLVLFGTFAVGFTLLSAGPVPNFGPSVLCITLMGAVLFLEPALLVVGFDLAEIASETAAVSLGRLGTSRGGGGTSQLVRTGLLVAGIVVASWLQISLGDGLGDLELMLTAMWVAGLTGAAALFVLLARRRASPAHGHQALAYRYVMLAAIALFLIVSAGRAFTIPDDRYFNYAGAHDFSVYVPAPLKPGGPATPTNPLDSISPVQVNFQSPRHRPPTVSIYGVAGSGRATPTSVNQLADIPGPAMPIVLGAPDEEDGWRRGMAVRPSNTANPFRFVVMERDFPSSMPQLSMNWYIVCGDRQDKFEDVSILCERVRSSFMGAVRTRTSPALAAVMAAALACAAVGVLVLADVRRRRGPTPALDLTFWMLVLSTALQTAGFAWGGVDDPLADTQLLAWLLAAVIVVAALVGAALEAAPRRWLPGYDVEAAREVAAEALAALVAIAAVLGLYVGAAGRAEGSQVIRGVVICLALTWELATAGGQLNASAASSPVFPRSSRLLIFMAYLMLVATCVLFFSGEPSIWLGRKMDSWDTEGIVARGLVILGGALVAGRMSSGLAAVGARPPAQAPATPSSPEGAEDSSFADLSPMMGAGAPDGGQPAGC
jgi:hypothetical protein